MHKVFELLKYRGMLTGTIRMENKLSDKEIGGLLQRHELCSLFKAFALPDIAGFDVS